MCGSRFWRHVSSFKRNIKHILIEGASLGGAFLADMILMDAGEENVALRFSFDRRIYYLFKNSFLLLDAYFTGENADRHICAGAFNLGVALSLLPATHFLQHSDNPLTQMVSEAIIFGSGSTMRMLVEMRKRKQTIKQHLLMHKGKLFSGAAGVFVSITKAGPSAVAFYWSGELLDSWLNRPAGESIKTMLLKPGATVPLQVLGTKIIAVGVKLSNKTIPFPEFIIDFMLGMAHQLMATRPSVVGQTTELKTITTERKSTLPIEHAPGPSETPSLPPLVIPTSQTVEEKKASPEHKEGNVQAKNESMSNPTQVGTSALGLFSTATLPCQPAPIVQSSPKLQMSATA